MFRLNVMNSTDILILMGLLSKPRTSVDIIMGYGRDPNVVDAMSPDLNGVDPL